jgi:hypothetical protein
MRSLPSSQQEGIVECIGLSEIGCKGTTFFAICQTFHPKVVLFFLSFCRFVENV